MDKAWFREILGTFTAYATGQLNVLGHDGDTLGVNGAQVGVLEQADQICFAGFLQCHHGRTLKAQIGLEVLGDFTNQPLERQLANQQLGAFLVPTNFSERHRSGPVAMRLLHPAGSGCAFARGFCGQLFARGLAAGGFTCRLLGSCHCVGSSRALSICSAGVSFTYAASANRRGVFITSNGNSPRYWSAATYRGRGRARAYK